MNKVQKDNFQVNEEETIKAFLRFRNYSADKQAFAIAFLNGMEFQKSISEMKEVKEVTA